MKKLLAICKTSADLAFFGKIAELLSPVVTVDLVANYPEDLAPPYDGQLLLKDESFPGLACYQLPTDLDPYQLSQIELVQLVWEISQFVTNLDQLSLNQLPLHIALTNKNNQVIYHNGRPKDPFLFDELDQAPVEDWIIDAVKESPNHAVHLLLPSLSFEQILIQSYQGLYEQGQMTGIFQQVQDIKPLLASYLKETGQALVGWSDTVSGASIKTDTFDDEF